MKSLLSKIIHRFIFTLTCLDTVFSGHPKHFQTAFKALLIQFFLDIPSIFKQLLKQSFLNRIDMKLTPVTGNGRIENWHNVFVNAMDISMHGNNKPKNRKLWILRKPNVIEKHKHWQCLKLLCMESIICENSKRYVCFIWSKSQKHYKPCFLHHNNKNLQLNTILMTLLQITPKRLLNLCFEVMNILLVFSIWRSVKNAGDFFARSLPLKLLGKFWFCYYLKQYHQIEADTQLYYCS